MAGHTLAPSRGIANKFFIYFSKILLDFFPVAFGGTLFMPLGATVPDPRLLLCALACSVPAQVRIKNPFRIFQFMAIKIFAPNGPVEVCRVLPVLKVDLQGANCLPNSELEYSLLEKP